MVDIDYPQFRMLRRIKRHKTVKSINFTKDQLEICDHLKLNGFITVRTVLSASPHYNEYRITQKGKAQLCTFKSQFYKTRTSLILSVFSTFASVVSTIVAIIALLK